MFDEKKYRDTFSEIHATSDTLAEIKNRTHEKSGGSTKMIARVAVACAALVLLPTITAYAYNHFKSVSLYYDGGTELIESEIQIVDETVQQENYRIHVDSVLADSYSTLLGFSIEALTEEAKVELEKSEFDIRELISFDYEGMDATLVSMTCKSSEMGSEGRLRSFAVRLDGFGAPNKLRLYMQNQKDSAVEINVDDQVETLMVTAVSVGQSDEYFIRSCKLSATGISFDLVYKEPVQGDHLMEIYFRKANGDLITLPQLAGNDTEIKIWQLEDDNPNAYRYTQAFSSLINPLSITGVVMNGVEYSFISEEHTTDVNIPDTLRPFLSPFVEMNDTFYVYADSICKKIGASLEKNGDMYILRYLDNTIELSVGDKRIGVNGEEQITNGSAAFKGQSLLLPSEYISNLGVRISMFYPKRGRVQAPEYWLITP